MTQSVSDNTIMSALISFPGMSSEEANEYIGRIERPENVRVARALAGQIGREDLADDERQTFDEYTSWANQRQQRIRNEQLTARAQRQQTRLALNLIQKHEQGLISDETLIMYGISGPLPDRYTYMAMSPEEKEALWAERMEQRFGPHWRTIRSVFAERVGHVVPRYQKRTYRKDDVNWNKEGF